MKNKISLFLKKIVGRSDFPFIVVALLYILLFIFLPITGDDASLIPAYSNLSISDHWNLVVYDYNNWSSRILVNFVIHFLLGKGKYVWVIINALVCFVLCKSLSKLFVDNDKRKCNIIISSFILLYPIVHLGSAGWMITYMTYFWPMTFGFVAMIPIKKIVKKEKFKIWEYITYSLSLVYATNEELELVLILCCYFIFFIYLMKEKLLTRYYISQFGLSILSLIFTLTCPGNGTRGTAEIAEWFKNYKMLNLIDKIDIGFTSTLQELIYGSNIFFIVICMLLAIIVWKKYEDDVIRIISLVPITITILFGPLKSITFTLFSRLEQLTVGISDTGLVSVSNNGGITMLRFFIICIFAFTFIVSILLSLENMYYNIFSMILLVAGTASRVAMGFSPTIFASGFRTATPMWFGLIAIGIILFSQACRNNVFREQEKKYLIYICIIFAVLSYINSGIIVNA